MPAIELRGVTYAHRDSVPIFSNLDLRLEAGWTGVVGPNGAGKTTLLRLMTGDLVPDGGEVRQHPARLSCELCEQRVDDLTAEVRRFAECDSAIAHQLQGQLELELDGLDRWRTLSPGERKRWQIGAALSTNPTILLLDEPTNHLDTHARELLLPALARFRGVGILVSHDRALLDALTERTLRVHRERTTLYRGAYEVALQTWQAEERQLAERRDQLQKDRAKSRRRLSQRRNDRAHAEAGMRTSKNMKNLHDSAARGAYKATRRRSAEASVARQVHLERARLERVEDALSSVELAQEAGGSLFVDYTPARCERLFSLSEPELVRGGRVLVRDARLVLGCSSRVHLVGPNGAGKSTLLEHLLQGAAISEDKLLYLPQELDAAGARGLLEGLREAYGRGARQERGLPGRRATREQVSATSLPFDRRPDEVAPTRSTTRRSSSRSGSRAGTSGRTRCARTARRSGNTPRCPARGRPPRPRRAPSTRPAT